MKRTFCFVVCGVLAATVSFAQRDFSNTSIEAVHVAGSVYMLKGEGGNIGLSIGKDGVLMVDDQFAPLHDKIMAAINELNQGDIKFVLNTHWHGDHTGGNEALAAIDTTVIAHDNVRKRLAEGLYIPLFDRKIDPRPKEALPVITYERSVTIHFNGEPIDVIHVPTGHTDGDSVIFFRESGVVHMGDQFFNGFYPYIDLSSGGSVEGYMNNIENILSELPDNIKIIPGHGPLGNKEDLKALLSLLREATGIVLLRVSEGQSLEQAVEVGLPQSIEEKWGGGFLSTEKWLTILYNYYVQIENT
jgi:cyclase